MRVFAVIALGLVTACGADGLPTRPNFGLGIKIGPNGITPTASVSTKAGPVTVSAGL